MLFYIFILLGDFTVYILNSLAFVLLFYLSYLIFYILKKEINLNIGQNSLSEKNINLFTYILISFVLLFYLLQYSPIADSVVGLLSINHFFIHNMLSIIGYNFIHIEFLHLFLNLLFLYLLSKTIKGLINFDYFLLLFILSIILTGLSTYIYYNLFHEKFVVVGLSGFIYSLFGYLWSFISRRDKFINMIFILMVHFLVPNIAFISHLSGFIVGLVVFYIFSYKFELKTGKVLITN